MVTETTMVEPVPNVNRAGLSFTRRKLVVLLAILALLLAGTVAIAPPALAGYCGHDNHSHSHNGHMDFYTWQNHYNEAGFHWHTWRNETHGQVFTVQCAL